MAYPKLWSIRSGDRFVAYGGFSCIPANTIVTVEQDGQGLFFPCADGRHYLESQRDQNGDCLGLTPLL
ncbi:MAG: hypothetical protein ABI191_02480 [Rhizomicrobium sp.]